MAAKPCLYIISAMNEMCFCTVSLIRQVNAFNSNAMCGVILTLKY